MTTYETIMLVIAVLTLVFAIMKIIIDLLLEIIKKK